MDQDGTKWARFMEGRSMHIGRANKHVQTSKRKQARANKHMQTSTRNQARARARVHMRSRLKASDGSKMPQDGDDDDRNPHEIYIHIYGNFHFVLV